MARTNDRETTDRMLAAPWARDGLNSHEYQIAASMLELTSDQEGETIRRILEMEFMEEPTRTDAAAVTTIKRLRKPVGAKLHDTQGKPRLPRRPGRRGSHHGGSAGRRAAPRGRGHREAAGPAGMGERKEKPYGRRYRTE